MRVLTFKNFVLTCLQLPLVFLRLIVACLDYLLVRSLIALGNPLSWPIDTAIQVKYDNEGTNIKSVLNLLSIQSDRVLDSDRKFLERTTAGRQAVKTNSDRQLYAVLKPTRAENLRRIENVLKEMDSTTLCRVLHNASKVLEKLNK